MLTTWLELIDKEAFALTDRLIAFRRHLHKYPELSGHEVETTRFIYNFLRSEGLEPKTFPASNGLYLDYGHIPDEKESSGSPELGSLPERTGVVAFRADIDALPISEQTDVDYRSVVEGVMHACGHDVHTTIGVGVVMTLVTLARDHGLDIPWRAIFQPEEETGRGAKQLIDQGVLSGVREIVAYHVDPLFTVGHIAHKVGPMNAGCSVLEVEINGFGGHGARPHLSKDPVAAAAHFINAVYGLYPRVVDSRKSIVVSFGSIQGGEVANVIPDRVQLKGTIRWFDPNLLEDVKAAIVRVADAVSSMYGVEAQAKFTGLTFPVINDRSLTETCVATARLVMGNDSLVAMDLPSMGSEDFASYMQKIPGCMMRLGITPPDKEPRQLHHSDFDVDERAIEIGVKVLAACVVQLAMGRPKTLVEQMEVLNSDGLEPLALVARSVNKSSSRSV